jgi:hypothetical protein
LLGGDTVAGGKHVIGAVLTLKDNMSATLRGVRKEQSAFKKDITSTRKELEKTFKKKMEARLDATRAYKEMTKLKTAMAPFRKKIVTAMALKDMASRKITKTVNELKSMGRRVFSPVIKIKDNISSVSSKMKGLAKSAAGVALAASVAIGGAGVGMLKSGADLEKQQVSMGHFIGINNKGKSASGITQIRDSFLKDLRENSNVTPFTSQEVIRAGTRALGITGGNTKEAMELVKIAEDMAALTPGKTVSDAMESLADAKNGEMERLKEFNAKVSAEEFKKLGFKGIVDTRLKSQFEGGAAKLSQTGSGLVSTIKGRLASRAQDAGIRMLEKSKPLLQGIINILDSPKINSFSTKVGGVLSAVGTKALDFAKLIGDNWSKIGSKFDWIVSKATFFKDVWDTSWSAVKAVTSAAMPIIEPIWGIIASGAQMVFTAFQLAFPYVKEITSSVWSVVEPILSKLGDALGWVADKAGAIAGWLNKKLDSSQSKGSVDGRHYSGLDYVPFDGYTAKLHKGEGIVRASENPHNRRNSISTTNNNKPTVVVNINGTNMTPRQILNELVPELKLALANM